MAGDPRNLAFTLYPYFTPTLTRGEGSRVFDTEGKAYLDLAAGQLSAALGHGHQRIVAAAQRQAGRLVHVGNRFFCDAVLDALAEISSVCPAGMDRVALCSTGSEANELAVRIARAATGKHGLVGVHRGYYGATHELLSLSEFVGTIKGVGVRAPGLERILCPDCGRCPLSLTHPACGLRCIDASAQQLAEQSTGDFAAFIVEPVLGSAGIIVPPPGWMEKVRGLCDRYKALLIADEAQTGLGRTGRWLGMEHSGVKPDVIVLSKALGAGFPVAAVVTTAAIEDRCLRAPLANSSSHSFDPFAGAVAAEVIRTIRDETLVERAADTGAYLADGLRGLAGRHRILGAVRGLGLMVGMDVVDPDTGKPHPLMSLALEAECVLHGLILGYSALSGAVRLLPPLNISRAEVDEALSLIDTAASYIEDKGVNVARYMPAHPGSRKLAATVLQSLS